MPNLARLASFRDITVNAHSQIYTHEYTMVTAKPGFRLTHKIDCHANKPTHDPGHRAVEFRRGGCLCALSVVTMGLTVHVELEKLSWENITCFRLKVVHPIQTAVYDANILNLCPLNLGKNPVLVTCLIVE